MNSSLVLALMMLVLVVGDVAAKPRHRSPLLHSKATHDAVQEVAQDAQKTDSDIDVRLIPKVDTVQDHMKVCCLHANILEFYLHSILPQQADRHPKMSDLREDLSRISRDLKHHGCSVSHYRDNPHSRAFSKKLAEMGEDRGINKAIGEIDILFTYLRDSCVKA